MNRIVHKLFIYGNKISLTLALVLALGCFVYSGNGGGDDFNNYGNEKIVKFYPNPATSVINFEFPTESENNYVLQVFSFTGKKMTEVPVSSNKISINLTNEYYRGLYFFHLNEKATGRPVEVGKFQVVR